MIQNINMIKLLSMIKQAKFNVDKLYTELIDPSTRNDSIIFVQKYNNLTGLTSDGMSKEETCKYISSIHNRIIKSINELQKLQFIKDEINNSSKITIPIINSYGNFSPKEVTINQALMLSNKRVQDYKLNYIERLVHDYSRMRTFLKKKQELSLDQEKIDRYINAKLNSLGINSIENDSDIYKKYANEYIDANKSYLYDPLDIGETILNIDNELKDYFDTIDSKIKSFNSSTMIWINLESSDNFWGFIK